MADLYKPDIEGIYELNLPLHFRCSTILITHPDHFMCKYHPHTYPSLSSDTVGPLFV